MGTMSFAICLPLNLSISRVAAFMLESAFPRGCSLLLGAGTVARLPLPPFDDCAVVASFFFLVLAAVLAVVAARLSLAVMLVEVWRLAWRAAAGVSADLVMIWMGTEMVAEVEGSRLTLLPSSLSLYV